LGRRARRLPGETRRPRHRPRRDRTLLLVVADIDASLTDLVVVSAAVERAECAILDLETPLLALEKNKVSAAVARIKELQALPEPIYS
jgi:hypothetical protein